MPRTGKCPNYAGCLLAYRGEVITVADDVPFVCPECKQPLVGASASGRPVNFQAIILGGISLLVISGSIAVYIQVRRFREQQPQGQIGSSFEQAQIAAEHQEFLPSRHMTIPDSPTPAVAEAPSAMPAVTTNSTAPAYIESGVQAQTPNLNLQDTTNQRVRADVLQRIDLAPNITSEDKDKLYVAVDRARQMGRILTIPFPKGHVAVSPDDVDQLKSALATTDLMPLEKDPTCVFVILGFADMQGDEKANLRISGQRAQSVLDALRDQCGVLNVMHAVGMGGSTLFGNEKDADRNRVVEVWAVLP